MKAHLILLSMILLGVQNTKAQTRAPAPTSLAVYACGKGKLILYWDKVKGAKGYWIYRSTKEGKSISGKPLVKLGFVPDSFPGSPMKSWVDHGLKEQHLYFYRVRAVDSKGRLSAASREDGEYVFTGAPPLDSKDARKILGVVIKQADGSSLDGKKVHPNDSFSFSGPDGMSYNRYKGKYFKEKPQPVDFATPTA